MESGPCSTGLTEAAVATNHRSFVHYEDGAFAGVGGDGGRGAAVCCGLSEVNAPVNGARLKSCVSSHDLGCSASGGEQFHWAAKVSEHPYQCRHGGGFSRTGIAANDQAAARLRADKEAPQRMNQSVLTGRWLVWEGGPEAFFYFVGCGGCGHGRGGVRR